MMLHLAHSITGKKRNGFTLVEMMVSLTIAGLLAVLISVGLNLGVKSWNTIIGQQTEREERLNARYLLNRLLGNVQSEVIYAESGESIVAFQGSRDELFFVAPLQLVEGFDDLYWIHLAIKQIPGNEQGYLTLHFMPFSLLHSELDETLAQEEIGFDFDLLREQISSDDAQEVVFKQGIDEVEFEYLEIDRERFPQWHSDWNEEKKLPDLIALRTRTDQGGSWLTIMIKPRVRNYEAKTLAY